MWKSAITPFVDTSLLKAESVPRAPETDHALTDAGRDDIAEEAKPAKELRKMHAL